MAKSSKSGGKGKTPQKKTGAEEVHSDQKAAEREEARTREMQEKTSPTDSDAADRESPEKKHSDVAKGFPIVGIGASAGGLEALESFLSNVSENCGIAFVVVSHTDPDRASMLPDILKRKSRLKVSVVDTGIGPEQNRVYLPPSDKDLVIEGGVFRLEERGRKHGLHMPIDRFFKSLAEDQGDLAGCVVLSGTGTDGTNGLRRIKEKAGVAISQSLESARHAGMPQSAIDTGLVDFVLPPHEMPEKLIRYFKHPGKIEIQEKAEEKPSGILQKILAFLVNRTNHDFSLYKKNTLIRRIERRMSITGSSNGEEYLRHLRKDGKEAEALFGDLLIGVTNFFRDPEAFEFLKNEVLPGLIGRNSEDGTLRVWIPGCSTGEEAYSVAIVLREAMEEMNEYRQVQIFATDLDRNAVEKARHGSYIENIATDVSPDRLKKFFNKEDHLYQVKKDIRKPIIFAVQNVMTDPPFSNLDLLVCRNLLIYLEPDAQQKLIPLFHYTLRTGGALFLGNSESVGRFVNLFEPMSKKFSVYRKKDVRAGNGPAVEFPTKSRGLGYAREASHVQEDSPGTHGMAHAVERVLLKTYTPTCLVVDRDGRILHIHGRTGKYLEQPEGSPSFQIVNMAREGLRFALISSLRKAAASGEKVRQERLRVQTNGGFQEMNLEVKPLSEPPELKGNFIVVFEDLESVPERKREKKGEETNDDGARVIELEKELARVRQQYQGSLEELESSNEELRSLNEEIHSSNEELQSTNEELESSREELQSLNEELATVNSELHSKIEELSEAYSTITKVLDSTQISILFLDNKLLVKRFTRAASRLINLIDSDIGRPLDHISHHLEYQNLTKKIQQVIETLTPFEDDVKTRDGHWYRMRIMIYRTTENVIDGAVVTFVNIDAQKEARAEAEEGKQTFEALMTSVPMGIAIAYGPDGRIRAVSRFGRELTGRPLEEITGIPVELHAERWNYFRRDGLKPATSEELPLARAVQKGEVVQAEEWLIARPDGARVPILCTAAPIRDSQKNISGAVLGWQDIRELKQAEKEREKSDGRFRALVEASSEALYRMSPDWEEMRQLHSRGFLADTEDPSRTWLQDHVPPEDQQKVMEAVNKAIRDKSVFQLEHRVKRVDGAVGWVLSRAVPMLDEQGEIEEWFGATTDITESKGAEAEKCES